MHLSTITNLLKYELRMTIKLIPSTRFFQSLLIVCVINCCWTYSTLHRFSESIVHCHAAVHYPLQRSIWSVDVFIRSINSFSRRDLAAEFQIYLSHIQIIKKKFALFHEEQFFLKIKMITINFIFQNFCTS
jgi:hypothetical protein